MRTVTIWYSANQVRRSAAKCLSAVLGSRPELLSEFYKSVSPALIARFKGTIVSQYFCKLLSLCSLLSSCYSNFLECRKGELHSTTVLIKFTFCKLGKKEYMYHVIGLLPVPDPDLEIRVGGGVRGAVIETLREGGGGLVSKNNFLALQFGPVPPLYSPLTMLYICFTWTVAQNRRKLCFIPSSCKICVILTSPTEEFFFLL